jgi:hypothetical protein
MSHFATSILAMLARQATIRLVNRTLAFASGAH